jgi:hypothetical protein
MPRMNEVTLPTLALQYKPVERRNVGWLEERRSHEAETDMSPSSVKRRRKMRKKNISMEHGEGNIRSSRQEIYVRSLAY